MTVVHVHWAEREYQVVRIAEQQPPEVAFCNSPEQLVVVLRGLGVAFSEVSQVFEHLEDSADASVRV